MPILGYTQWRRFDDVVERALFACQNSGMVTKDHFASAGKMIEAGKGAVRRVKDYHFTRYGAYLVAMNGDPRKDEIAAAQTYFAVKTREAEIAPKKALPSDYVEALRALIVAEEEKERLALEAKRWEDALQAAFPAIDFHQKVSEAINGQTISQAARALNVGSGKFWKFIQDEKYVFKNGENWVAMQRLCDQGYFLNKEKVRVDANGESRTYLQTLVTGKGLVWLQKKWDAAHGGKA